MGFSFSILNLSSTALWPSWFVLSAVSLIEYSLHMKNCFSLAVFQDSAFGFWQFGDNVSYCGSPSWFYLEFSGLLTMCRLMSFIKFGGIFSHFFKYFFYPLCPSSPSETPVMCSTLVCKILFHRSFRYCSLFYILGCFSCSELIQLH